MRRESLHLVLLVLLSLSIIDGMESQSIDAKVTIEDAKGLMPFNQTAGRLVDVVNTMSQDVHKNTETFRFFFELAQLEIPKTKMMAEEFTNAVRVLQSISPFMKGFMVAVIVVPAFLYAMTLAAMLWVVYVWRQSTKIVVQEVIQEHTHEGTSVEDISPPFPSQKGHQQSSEGVHLLPKERQK